MNFERIKDTQNRYFDGAYRLCESSFPIEERRDIGELLRVMKNDDYHFCVLLDGDELCGIVLYWEIGELIYSSISQHCPRSVARGLELRRLSCSSRRAR